MHVVNFAVCTYLNNILPAIVNATEYPIGVT